MIDIAGGSIKFGNNIEGEIMIKSELRYEAIKSPIGDIIIAEYLGKIVFLEFLGNNRAKMILDKISKLLDIKPQKGPTPILKRAEKQLNQYFVGKLRDFDLPIQLIGTDFQKSVWRQLNSIRFGDTKDYGWMAKKVKNNSARAAGQAIGKNPISIIVPCRRVIGKNGSLTGFGGGLERKKWLLEHEGAL